MSFLKQQLKEIVHEMIDAEYQYHPGVSTKAAAEVLQVHEQTIRAWIKQGKLRSRGTGSFHIDMRDILKLNRNEQLRHS